MDQNDFEARCAARLISQIEGIALKAVLHERRRWAEAYQALQNQLEELRSDNVRLNIQVQSHQLESTNRALWLKRKSDFDALDTRPTKLSRHEDPPSQSFAPPTPSSFRGLSSDRDDEAEGSTAVPADTARGDAPVNPSDATRPRHHPRPSRPVSRLPSRAQSINPANPPLPCDQGHEMERVVYCLCGGHDYGLMIHCDNPKCELVWFHAGCVNLKVVPDEKEEWFCPACAGSRVQRLPVPSRQLTEAAVQTATTSVDSGCQVNPEPPTQMPSPCTSPPKRSLVLAPLQPEAAKEQARPRLLSPFVPRSKSGPESQLERSVTPLPIALGQMSPCSTLTPLSSVATQTPRDLSSEPPSREQGAILIHVDKKLIASSRKSLFRCLQPTARKPWLDEPDNS